VGTDFGFLIGSQCPIDLSSGFGMDGGFLLMQGGHLLADRINLLGITGFDRGGHGGMQGLHLLHHAFPLRLFFHPRSVEGILLGGIQAKPGS
jgi:hypothetical protein